MNFKSGDKVWIENSCGDFPAGTFKAIVIGPDLWGKSEWWQIEFEDIPNHPRGQAAHVSIMRPRDDPPPQQEPKREQTGNWDSCVWKPAREVA